MKLSCGWSGDFEYAMQYDEIIVDLKPKTDYTGITPFFEKHTHQKIVLHIADSRAFLDTNPFDKLEKELKNYDNFGFMLRDVDSAATKKLMQDLRDREWKYFFDIFCSDIDMVWSLIDKGASEVYITAALGFDLGNIHKKIHNAGVQIRVFPNVVQSNAEDANSLTAFWIRPEDLKVYEEVVDVCEIFVPERFKTEHNAKKNAYYRIYGKNKDWYGNLNEIIAGLDVDIDSRATLPYFGIYRVNCGKRCLKDSNCSLCHKIASFSNSLIELDLKIDFDIEDEEEILE